MLLYSVRKRSLGDCQMLDPDANSLQSTSHCSWVFLYFVVLVTVLDSSITREKTCSKSPNLLTAEHVCIQWAFIKSAPNCFHWTFYSLALKWQMNSWFGKSQMLVLQILFSVTGFLQMNVIFRSHSAAPEHRGPPLPVRNQQSNEEAQSSTEAE